MTRGLMMLVLVLGGASAAQNKKLSAREEIARLEKELAEQRSLLVRMLELQNECTTQMIQAAQGLEYQVPTLRADDTPAITREPPPPGPGPRPPPPPVVTTPRNPEGGTSGGTGRQTSAEGKLATLSGKVQVGGGGPAWVFVEDVKGPPATGAAEIRQEDKQFVPPVLAVQSGTRVAFPNLDVVFHNVFSLTPGQTFDLGMQRAGDPVKSKVMSKPGVVEIFCNIHSRMTASVLVVPGPLLAKVARDGSFKLENVPVGSHKVSAWAGGRAMATKTVDVAAGGTTVQFEVSAPGSLPHTTKTGQPYGSYEATQ
jgi:plastocyanin